MVFLPFQNLLGNEHREIGVLDAQGLDSVIEPSYLVINDRGIFEGVVYLLWMISQML